MSAEKSLYQTLSAYGESDFYPCHMPGHKRSPLSGEMADFYKIDITEIEGFDNLHQAEGILMEAQKRANRLYGTDETFFLVNGSTCGVLAAVMAAAGPGDEILMARNCHKSVYHAAILQGLQVDYYYPGMILEYDICDGVCPEEIGRLLNQFPDCKAVVITSPTYEGIVSDVAKIAAVVHERNKILIVDEAHGAHLCIGGMAGEKTNKKETWGQKDVADLVIHSLHKTLPSMTQTALLHVNGNRVDRVKLRRYLSMLQSSSPSYVLMASMDSCVRFLEEQGQTRFTAMRMYYETFCNKLKNLQKIRVGKMTDLSESGYVLTDWDIGKIVISVKETNMTGKELSDVLRKKYHLELEMAATTYALAMMTMMDEAEGWQRLADALIEIDGRIEKEPTQSVVKKSVFGEAKLTMAEAFHSRREEIILENASGRISADFITPYPPGIPFVTPGERIDEVLIKEIRKYWETGLCVQGVSSDGRIGVIVEIPEKIWHDKSEKKSLKRTLKSRRSLYDLI